MGMMQRIQEDMKAAMKAREHERLECLRLLKGALTLKEKESGGELDDGSAVAVLRSELRKRRDSIDVFLSHGKKDDAAEAEAEIRIIEEFLPQQLTAAQLEEKVRAYLESHPEVTHAGKLTGAMKKELGDQADGKTLNEVCRKALGA